MNLKNLSDLLGLSQTTVSRALNGYPEVSEATRARVAEAARANNYMPSQTARGLATGKTGAIGHIIPLGEHRMINPHFADFIAGAGKRYAASGLDIVMSVSSEEHELESYRRLARANRVDGFVLQAPLIDDARIGLLRDLNFPFVVHGRAGTLGKNPDVLDRSYAWLDVDNLDAFDRATQHLLDLGHRDIALINGLEFMNFAYLRRKGFERALARHDIAPRPDFLFSADMSEPYGYEATNRLLARSDRPSAILTASKLIATGCQRAITENGLVLGRDISLMTFDDHFGFFGTRARVPNITCVRSSLFEAGEKVADMITRQIADPDQPPEQVLWLAELIVGKSTSPPPSR